MTTTPTLAPCRACGQSGHRITQCSAIVQFDLVSHLREQLANAHEAMGAALALMAQGDTSAARAHLQEALRAKS